MQSQVAASAAIVARCLSPSSTELATLRRADSRGAQHSGLTRDAGTADAEANVIKWQAGDSFDFSIVLCSLLLGTGYNAYVVYGTAPK